ncbi:glutamate racemase [Lacrimispora sp. NSJ-141]|uniref:Glutamate racemase n=1 Tax=Lientehia hominis TaxID=2897778 RepID=A0AAP2RHR0_9FIRM|nr:glutamate racemase [Lientehia hominis]MCD2491991.1 glutamate racemase [Lientehia hominis]
MGINAPIGVFDSGVGGLTVAREIMRQIPDERMVYFGDTARLPYGTKSKETVIRYSKQIIRFLKTKQVKAIVVACNTATAQALEEIKNGLDIPVIGVIDAAARVASEVSRNGRIGVIGTTGTIESGMYEKALKEYNPQVQVYGKACPLLVSLVEEGWLHDSVTEEVVSRYMKDLEYKSIDTLILGCTHYPLLRSIFRKVAGEGVTLVNPAYETAMELSSLLDSKGLRCGQNVEQAGRKYEFYVSDAAEKFCDFANSILPYDIEKVQQLNVECYEAD